MNHITETLGKEKYYKTMEKIKKFVYMPKLE